MFRGLTVQVVGGVLAAAIVATGAYVWHVLSKSDNDPDVAITTPADNQSVESTITVRGTFANIGAERAIWIMVLPQLAAERYYPQQQAQRSDDGSWSATAYLGTRSDERAERFHLLAVLADRRASEAFHEYLRTGEFTGLELPLREGARELDKITVMRAGAP